MVDSSNPASSSDSPEMSEAGAASATGGVGAEGGVRSILRFGSPILSTPAAPVPIHPPSLPPPFLPPPALRDLIFSLWETLYAADALGLAAPQIGVSQQVAVVRIPPSLQSPAQPRPPSTPLSSPGRSRELRLVLINPSILSRSGRQRGLEGCLSFPRISLMVTRPQSITLTSIAIETAQPYTFEAHGLLARVICHEVDHLQGVLFLKYVSLARRREVFREIDRLKAQGEWE